MAVAVPVVVVVVVVVVEVVVVASVVVINMLTGSNSRRCSRSSRIGGPAKPSFDQHDRRRERHT